VWVCEQLHTAVGAHFIWGFSASTRSVGRTPKRRSWNGSASYRLVSPKCVCGQGLRVNSWRRRWYLTQSGSPPTVLQFRWFEAPRVSIKLGLLQPGAAAQPIRSRSTIRPCATVPGELRSQIGGAKLREPAPMEARPCSGCGTPLSALPPTCRTAPPTRRAGRRRSRSRSSLFTPERSTLRLTTWPTRNPRRSLWTPVVHPASEESLGGTRCWRPNKSRVGMSNG
jgi:hypothetical protein